MPRSQSSHSPTRRSVMRGAAWATPIVIAGVSAPALAVSPTCASQDVALNWGFAQYSGNPSLTSSFTTNVTFNPNPPNGTYPSLNSPLRATIVHTYFGQARGSTQTAPFRPSTSVASVRSVTTSGSRSGRREARRPAPTTIRRSDSRSARASATCASPSRTSTALGRLRRETSSTASP